MSVPLNLSQFPKGGRGSVIPEAVCLADRAEIGSTRPPHRGHGDQHVDVNDVNDLHPQPKSENYFESILTVG